MVTIGHAAGLLQGDYHFYRAYKTFFVFSPQYQGGQRNVKPISLLQNTPTRKKDENKKKRVEMNLP
jgi:hypothetical protein